MNRTAVIRDHGRFAVIVPSALQQDVAERFAGRGGIEGEDRYRGATWHARPSGASGLDESWRSSPGGH